VAVFTFFLEHERGRAAIPPSEVQIMLAEPTWNKVHLVRMLKGRLGKIELAAPVIALRLDATQVEAMVPPNESLFPEPGGTPADFNRLLKLLTARLGKESVLQPVALDAYRPEVCNTWAPRHRQVGGALYSRIGTVGEQDAVAVDLVAGNVYSVSANGTAPPARSTPL
jgi:protein ImuB